MFPAAPRWRARGRTARRALVALLAVCLASCGLDTYTFGGGDDTPADGNDTPLDGQTGDGNPGIDGPPGDGGVDACIPFPELCDEADNDCNGMVDEGFNLTADPANCGACGNRCSQPNTSGVCVDSACVYTCAPGFVDTDGDPSNGCDYQCTVTNGGVEQCDFADNDCDTEVDEALSPPLTADPDNCGSCGNVCVALNADPLCVAGDCTFGACAPGFADVVAAVPGCEYQCPTAVTAETCDGVDQDCDAQVDELPIAGLGGACADPGFEAQLGVGRCTAGVLACSFGVPTCAGFVRPLGDDTLCNSVDDDCDGSTDEDVNFASPLTCGSCGNVCNLANAVEGCSGGACTIATCLPGFVDANDVVADGCEYACSPTGPEVCDGRDNDCDGGIDNGLVPPANFCVTAGECAGTAPVCAADACSGATTWICPYGGDAEVDACGDLPLQETECDGNDNDCDGTTDESFAQLGDACADDGLGQCRGEGSYVCDPANDARVTCEIDPATVIAATPETCDDVDNDCDGTTDEDAPDDMVPVTRAGGSTFYVYRYEASRPDATAAGVGDATSRSCSKRGVLPWRTVSHAEAEALCVAAGVATGNPKRLCTEADWQRACEGAAGLAYPYGNTYDPDACNGRDVDLDCAAPDDDELAPTGRNYACPVTSATSACVSPFGAVDMSGNLAEWTSTAVGTGFRVKGGNFNNIEQGLTCDLSFVAYPGDTEFPNLGFRCCADAPDPTP